MIDASITATGAAHGVGTQTPYDDVTLMLKGASFTEARATMMMGEHSLLSGTQINFHAFCARAIGTGSREWPHLATEVGLVWSEPGPPSTSAQNLVKVVMLVSLWIEPHLVSGEAAGLEDELNDDIIVDYTARLGSQRYVYFLPTQIAERSKEDMDTLFAYHLICRLTIRINADRIERYFVPLVPPGVLLERLGAANKVWLNIRDAMVRRVRTLGT